MDRVESMQISVDEVMALRQQLKHSEMAATAEAKYADELRQQLAKSQAQVTELAEMVSRCAQKRIEDAAREKVLRDSLLEIDDWDSATLSNARMSELLSMPADSTALDSAIRQAKREALLELSDMISTLNACEQAAEIRRMAEEMK
jgi:hypothetical protein